MHTWLLDYTDQNVVTLRTVPLLGGTPVWYTYRLIGRRFTVLLSVGTCARDIGARSGV